jgi:hypothetical protein
VNLVTLVILLVELVADLAGALVAESLLVSAGGENAHVLAVPVVLGAGVEGVGLGQGVVHLHCHRVLCCVLPNRNQITKNVRSFFTLS